MDTRPVARRPHPLGKVSAVARKSLWRIAFRFTGGLSVVGTPPQGPAIIVANHRSHADSPLLLAALPASARPVITPAADYWLLNRSRRLLLKIAVSAIPVHRGRRGAYDALRTSLHPLLNQGRVVILFPEGGRNTGEELRRFQSGPWRLAAELGVPLVPAAIVNTGALLPKGGRLNRHPVQVRFGSPIRPTAGLPAKEIRNELDALRNAISDMLHQA